MLYDPEYMHWSDTIHFVGSKTEFINEIFRLMTHSKAIEVASISEKKTIDFSAYDDLIKNSASTLLYPKGLHFIAHYARGALPGLFKLANDNTTDGKALRSAIASALVEKTVPGNSTGLHFIARFALIIKK